MALRLILRGGGNPIEWNRLIIEIYRKYTLNIDDHISKNWDTIRHWLTEILQGSLENPLLIKPIVERLSKIPEFHFLPF